MRLLKKYEITPGHKVMPDGREILDLSVPSAKRLYIIRVRRAYERQNERCILCGKYLCWLEAVGEHKIPKGFSGSTHDDREDNIRAAHPYCNSEKASRRDYPDYSDVL